MIPVQPNIIQKKDSVIDNQKTFDAEDLKRGERLFFGLVYIDNASVNCAGCHNTRVSGTWNWNPDALEISKKYLNKSASDLNKILLHPVGQKMIQVHKNFQLTAEDIVMIKGYMDQLVVLGPQKSKPDITNLLIFIIAFGLFLFSIIDLIITKIIKHQLINYIIFLSTGIFISYTLTVNALALGRSKDYSPDQPIKFSHQVHAGQNGIDCIYCHSYAIYSKSAGIPSENVCMNCHILVRNGKRSGSFEIEKILTSYENKKPVEWVKVYNLPDHVFFSHAQHVTAGSIGCKECHGEVEKMTRIRQVSNLSMGWCINCHRTRKVNFQKNIFYSEYKELAEKIRSGQKDSITVESIGGTQCMKCHY